MLVQRSRFIFCILQFFLSRAFLHPFKKSSLELINIRAFSNVIEQSAEESFSKKIGSITLLGSGPGDPDLLTVQALKRLQSASLVVSDRLVSKEILSLVSCELKIANKLPGCAEEAQDEINRWVIDAAMDGRNVVRLKIGDPFLFGRGGEEIIEYRKYGIEAVILPGLSSSYTAPLSAKIPLTHRGTANQVLISTGFGKNSTYVDLPEFHSERTIVLLMAVGRIDEISKSLLDEKHYPITTPVCIIEKATTPEERFIHGQLGNIAGKARLFNARPPATIIIGDVVDTLQTWN